MKKLIILLSKYLSTPFLFAQATPITQIENASSPKYVNSNINNKEDLYWSGKQLQYYIYKCCNIDNNSDLKSFIKKITNATASSTGQTIFTQDESTEFVMRFINSQLLWSKDAWNSYSDFFSEATTYWIENSDGIRTKLWDIINHWFLNVYTLSLTNNWYSNKSWDDYKTYVDTEVTNNNITKIDFDEQKETDIKPSDLGYDFYYSNGTWKGIDPYTDYTQPAFSTIAKQIIANDFDDSDSVEKELESKIDTTDELISSMFIYNTGWSTRGLAKEYNNFVEVFSSKQYSSFFELDSITYDKSKNGAGTDKYKEYNPGANISLSNSINAWAEYWKVSDTSVKTLEDDVLNTFNIMSYFSSFKNNNLLSYLYTFQIANDYNTGDNSLYVNSSFKEWVESKSGDSDNIYWSSQSASLIISGTKLKDSTISNEHVKLQSTLKNGTDLFYKSAGYILDGINAVAKAYVNSNELLYKSFVNTGEWLPTVRFSQYKIFGYGDNYFDYVIDESASNLISNIILYSSLGVASAASVSLIVYNYMTNRIKSKKRVK